MTRTLGEVPESERSEIVATIHLEAEQAQWHLLSNKAKGGFYREWASKFNLKHSAIKDQIMKGFDAAQRIPPSGEAAVHNRLKELLGRSAIPYTRDKVPLWGGRGVADFVLGYSPNWVTVVAELEAAPNWQEGMHQAVWYGSAYEKQAGLKVLPTLILFGSVTRSRWDEIVETCLRLNVLLTTFELEIDGDSEREFAIERLLRWIQ